LGTFSEHVRGMGVFQEKFFLSLDLTQIFFEQFNELREVIHGWIVVPRPARIFLIFSLASVGVDG
jgi:hypothetical protein